ncbi:phenylacetate--CoA ligase family protein [Afifella pfennigii]|uniref:phenylacetate--CoA ligase family protein n=1 Tax=Afifella pfennigii TaxID=209897 RepID=UPI000478C014|nr:AMP-binding protein [Afifella pfennigii]
MSDHFDVLETRPRQERERDFFSRLVPFLTQALLDAPGLQRHLAGIEPRSLTSREALARLPILRKAQLMEMQAEDPPFGGFVPAKALRGGRVFMSPGPIWEPQPPESDPWHAARALHAAGFRPRDMVINCFGYQMTPGGFILDEGARAIGCTVYPAGPGNSEAHAGAIAALKATAYLGTPDFLKVILDKAAENGTDVSSLNKALVSGGALFPSLREEYQERGIAVMQAYATADIGLIAYEGRADDGSVCPGMVVNETVLVEIVRPGTGDPVPDGEVGEVVVTTLNPAYPLVRFATGDLSAVLEGESPCGRTNMRLKGWLGRADQRTKVKGMFVDPAQIAELLKRRPEVSRARLLVLREGEQDKMLLMVEGSREGDIRSTEAIAEALRDITHLRGEVEEVAPGSLPNDGKVISDERKYD